MTPLLEWVRLASISVCPGYSKPALFMTAFDTGAVTMPSISLWLQRPDDVTIASPANLPDSVVGVPGFTRGFPDPSVRSTAIDPWAIDSLESSTSDNLISSRHRLA